MNRQDYKHDELTGNDVNIETSLKEYGLAWIETEEEYLFYYGIQHTGEEWYMFDFCSFPKNMDIRKEFDFVEWDKVNAFIGGDIMEYSLPQQISDLVSYYGAENIFGSSYWEGLTYNEVITGKTEETEESE